MEELENLSTIYSPIELKPSTEICKVIAIKRSILKKITEKHNSPKQLHQSSNELSLVKEEFFEDEASKTASFSRRDLDTTPMRMGEIA